MHVHGAYSNPGTQLGLMYVRHRTPLERKKSIAHPFFKHLVPAAKSAVVRIDFPGEVYCLHEIIIQIWDRFVFPGGN